MPVIRLGPTGPASAAEAEADMTAALAAELAAGPEPDAPLRQPIVIEQELPTHSLHVFVIWDQWRRLAARARSSVIMRAYERAVPERVDRITIALPATTDEAVALGLLPFHILPLDWPSPDPARHARLDQALRDEGAAVTPGGPALWLPNLDAARRSLDRLGRRTDPRDWVLERARGRTGSADDHPDE